MALTSGVRGLHGRDGVRLSRRRHSVGAAIVLVGDYPSPEVAGEAASLGLDPLATGCAVGAVFVRSHGVSRGWLGRIPPPIGVKWFQVRSHDDAAQTRISPSPKSI